MGRILVRPHLSSLGTFLIRLWIAYALTLLHCGPAFRPYERGLRTVSEAVEITSHQVDSSLPP